MPGKDRRDGGVHLVRAVVVFFRDRELGVTDPPASIEHVTSQREAAVMGHVLVPARALELLNGALIQATATARHPPLERMVGLDLDLYAGSVLGLPRVHVRPPVLRRIGVERDDLVPTKRLGHSRLDLRYRRLPCLPLRISGLPHRDLEQVAIGYPAANQRRRVRLALESATRTV